MNVEKFAPGSEGWREEREKEAAEHTGTIETIYEGLPDDKDELLKRRAGIEATKIEMMERGRETKAEDLNHVRDLLSAINRKLHELGFEEDDEKN